MQQITSFTPTLARALGGKIETKLRELKEELGLDFDVRVQTYGERIAKVAITAKVGDIDEKDTPEGATYLYMADTWGMKREWLGRIFMHRGTRYRLLGAKTSRPKYPLVCERLSDGTSFKFPISAVRTALG